MNYGQIIHSLRGGMKKSRLSKLSGVSRPTIDGIESGRTLPSMKTTSKILGALGTCMEAQPHLREALIDGLKEKNTQAQYMLELLSMGPGATEFSNDTFAAFKEVLIRKVVTWAMEADPKLTEEFGTTWAMRIIRDTEQELELSASRSTRPSNESTTNCMTQLMH